MKKKIKIKNFILKFKIYSQLKIKGDFSFLPTALTAERSILYVAWIIKKALSMCLQIYSPI